MIEEAIAFVRRAHARTMGRGTSIPCTTRPMETTMIISLMMEDEDLVVTASLHDVIEDTDVTPEELEERFGRRVTELVLEEMEDKSGSWFERKSVTVKHLGHVMLENRMLTLTGRLSNLRSTARDHMMVGKDIWRRFNKKDKSKHE